MQGTALHHRLLGWRRNVSEKLGRYKYSQTGYYDQLRKFLPVEQIGTFIEAGAHDGFTGSNTYSLEAMHGWKGVLVEPIPHLFERCRGNRLKSKVLHGALVPADYNGAFVEIADMGLVSSVTQSPHFGTSEAIHGSSGNLIKVPALTLDHCLDKAGLTRRPTFLSLDVEGFEADALKGLSLKEKGPDWLLVEMNYPDEVWLIIAPYYEKIAAITEIDWLFKRKPSV